MKNFKGFLKLVIPIWVTLFMLAGCSGPYTFEDSGSSIELGMKDSFQVVLKGKAESEYSWQLSEKPSFVGLESPPVIERHDNEIDYTFNFKVIAQGKETVTLIYTNGEVVKKRFELLVVTGTLSPIL